MGKIEGLKAVHPRKGNGFSLGHEQEPSQPHGPRVRGKNPPSHSHTAFPHMARKIGVTRKIHGTKHHSAKRAV